MNQFNYIGTELELFAQAKNWKNYLRSIFRRYLKGNVLEVGAGMGTNTSLLCRCEYDNWLCLEPDYQLFQVLKDTIESLGISNCKANHGTIDSLDNRQLFDAILYIDVLEHIEDDIAEVRQASAKLKDGGHLIILCPAHQWLFTPFDEAIGHYRRYNKVMLKETLPEDIEIVKLIYLDTIGLLASLANKVLLKQSQPTLKQIKLWDNLMIPISQKIDPVLGYNFGKSILLIGRKIQ